jgi:hypothetical protein
LITNAAISRLILLEFGGFVPFVIKIKYPARMSWINLPNKSGMMFVKSMKADNTLNLNPVE